MQSERQPRPAGDGRGGRTRRPTASKAPRTTPVTGTVRRKSSFHWAPTTASTKPRPSSQAAGRRRQSPARWVPAAITHRVRCGAADVVAANAKELAADLAAAGLTVPGGN